MDGNGQHVDDGEFLRATLTQLFTRLHHMKFCLLGLKLKLDPELDHTAGNIRGES
jgi:hypothetical protein